MGNLNKTVIYDKENLLYFPHCLQLTQDQDQKKKFNMCLYLKLPTIQAMNQLCDWKSQENNEKLLYFRRLYENKDINMLMAVISDPTWQGWNYEHFYKFSYRLPETFGNLALQMIIQLISGPDMQDCINHLSANKEFLSKLCELRLKSRNQQEQWLMVLSILTSSTQNNVANLLQKSFANEQQTRFLVTDVEEICGSQLNEPLCLQLQMVVAQNLSSIKCDDDIENFLIHGDNLIGILTNGEGHFMKSLNLISRSHRAAVHQDLLLFINRIHECYTRDKGILVDTSSLKIISQVIVDIHVIYSNRQKILGDSRLKLDINPNETKHNENKNDKDNNKSTETWRTIYDINQEEKVLNKINLELVQVVWYNQEVLLKDKNFNDKMIF